MTGNDIRKILARNIKNIRAQKQLSQADLAEKADIFIPFLSRILVSQQNAVTAVCGKYFGKSNKLS